MGKREKKERKVTKIPKTKRRKYGMNETYFNNIGRDGRMDTSGLCRAEQPERVS